MVPVIYNLRSLAVRKRTTGAAFFGIALVVFAISAVLMLKNGLQHAFGRSGSPENAIVMRQGSDAELTSGVQDAQVALVGARPEVARANGGSVFPGGSMAVGEIVVGLTLDKLGTSGFSNLTIRGTTPAAYALRPEIKIIEGRPAQPGTDEVVVGKAIRGRLQGVDLGQSFEITKGRKVTVVGVFDGGGSSFESEVWADIDVMRSAYHRQGSVSSVRVRLTSPDAFDAFKLGVEADKNIGLAVEREDIYYQKVSQNLGILITALGVLIAFFCAVGAMIGATITMYAAVAHRSREIGTLRALGFSRLSILSSFLLESMILALGGGLFGALLSLVMGLMKFSMINFATWSEIVIAFEPTPKILIIAIICGGVMGVIGGFFPAIRAARMSPLKAIRG